MISTKNLSQLPAIGRLRQLSQSLAMLDAILQREWEGRYYSFNAQWKPDEQMASMHNGEGDEWFCLFSAKGAFLKGLDHESLMAPANNSTGSLWPGLFDGLPAGFESAMNEPAFSIEQTSFCIWRTTGDTQWRRGDISFPPGNDPDGSEHLLAILDGNPNTYKEWAEEYYQRPVNLPSVEAVYARTPLTGELVRDLNSETSLSSLADDIAEIGYPSK
jgi:hypothetical protein